MKILASLIIYSALIGPALAAQPLTSLKGEQLKLHGLSHLVFFDLWTSYQGDGPEKILAALPEEFNAKAHRVWVQPEINVTIAQLEEFQGYYPHVQPLVLDKGYQLMRKFKVWQSPYHIVLKDGKTVFSGGNDQLVSFAKKYSQGAK